MNETVFTLNIEQGNEIFTKDGGRTETARILRHIANLIENGRSGGFCVDINGNRVGEYDFALV